MRIPFIKVEIPPKTVEVPLDAARASLDYLARHPSEVLFALRHAANLRVVVPLDALRWLLGRVPPGKGPRDVVLGTRPPALTVAATLDLMGNGVHVESAVQATGLDLGPDHLRLALRLSDFDLRALDPKSPIAQFLSSPSLDKTKPANLVSLMPARPALIAEAKDDRVVLDFMKIKKLGESPVAKRILGVVATVLAIAEIVAEDDHLLITWRPRMRGLKDAVTALRGGL